MKDKDKYFVETENLAFPEIHTGKVKQISSIRTPSLLVSETSFSLASCLANWK